MRNTEGEKANPYALAGYGLIALFWLGMVCGVSFLATPVKFQAQALSLPVALEVGNVTFTAFSRVEWGFAVLLMMMTVFAYGQRFLLAVTGIAVAIVLAQTFWLLPVLDARIAAVIAGDPLPASMHHFLYAGGEAVKALLLAGAGLFALATLARPER
ncbi:hypothetical protein [Nitratireductor rhodophyticola]